MNLVPWKPFGDIESFFNDDDFFSFVPTARLGQPAMDVYETEDSVVAEVELPGMSADDVDVVVEDGYLKIRGEHREEKKEGDKERGYWKREIRHGSFERMARIPTHVDDEKVKAEFQKGMLTVTMPKTEPKSKGKSIEVEDKD